MKSTHIKFMVGVVIAIYLMAAGSALDPKLFKLLEEHAVAPYKKPMELDSAKIELGQALFFDRILSGNKDVSCATCHHPGLNSGDNLPLAIGVGGDGLGTNRVMGPKRERIPRNSPEVFNRGAKEWHTMFWDSRVSGSLEEGFVTPADEKLPEGLDNILAVQAMFPVVSRDEMRGEIGDEDIFGEPNELALMSNAVPQSIWKQLIHRLLEIEGYQQLFEEAYPDVPQDKLGFQHAANAIAAFEIAAFTFIESPWDRYLRGAKEALTPEALRGAMLFYGKAKCGSCHSGTLMTDQLHHNLAIPQFGPGKDDAAPLDVGRYMETGLNSDRFAFRTPPLRNVTLTGPWMHNGAYNSLEDVIRHHLNPEEMLRNYDVDGLPPELSATYKGDPTVLERMLRYLDPFIKSIPALDDNEINDLMAFLKALEDPAAQDLSHLVPNRVPSDLPVETLHPVDKSY
ncbi:MAG: cytochrome c peroxidase [Cyclobacteriaceae bacterium]